MKTVGASESRHTSSDWLRLGILIVVPTAVAAFVFFGRPVQHLSEPGAREAADVTQTMQDRLPAPGDSRFNQRRVGQPRLAGPNAATGDATRPLSEAEDEGRRIDVPALVPGARSLDSASASRRSATGAADAHAAAAGHADDKTTAGAPPAGDKAAAPEPVRVKANSMQWDDPNVSKGDDGNVHVPPNATVRTEVDLNTPASAVAIWAHADQVDGAWPRLRVSVDGTPMGEVTINSADEKKFRLPIYADPGHAVVELTPIVDSADPSGQPDQSVRIRKIKVWPQDQTQ